MELQISITKECTKSYPYHKHMFWEILCYLEGEGYLYTPKENIPFKPGTIIVVPPETVHGSVSNGFFKNISLGGEFNSSFFSDSPIKIDDNSDSDGKTLATLLYKNKAANKEYLKSLTNAYINYILSAVSLEKPINKVINKIVNTISQNATKLDFNISELLKEYNYSTDYIRQQFKATTNMHPIEFLTKCRIEKAIYLIDIYGEAIPLSVIAESCGYTDYVYFSKQFKKYTKLSPKEYLNKNR